MSQPFPPDQGQPQPPYQQPYPQQPPQYPPFQQPVQQPPKKKSFLRSPLGIGCGVVAALFILVIVIVVIASAASGGGGSTANNPTPSGQSTAGTSQQSTPAATGNVIGKPVQSGDWQVVLNKISLSNGSEFDTPKSGDTFLVLNVTLKNTSSSAQTASSFVTFALKDSTGQTYQQDITSSGTPDGDVAPGGIVRGNIQYDVPKSVHNFVLQFTPGLDASQLVEWSIKA